MEPEPTGSETNGARENVFAATIGSSAQLTLKTDELVSPGARVVLEGVAPRDFVLRYLYWKPTSERAGGGEIIEGTGQGTDVLDCTSNLEDGMTVLAGARVRVECTLVAPGPRRVTCIVQGEPVKVLHGEPPRAAEPRGRGPAMNMEQLLTRARIYGEALTAALDADDFEMAKDLASSIAMMEQPR